MAWVVSAVFALVGCGFASIWWGEAWAEAKCWGRSKFEQEWKRTVRRYAGFQPDRILDQVPVLSLSSAIDEARAALRVSWWVHKASGVAVRLAYAVAAVVAVVAFGSVVYAVNLLLQAIQIHLPILFKVADALSTVLLLIAGIALLLILCIFVKILLPIASHSSIGAGFPNPKTNLIVKVKVCRDVDHQGVYTSHRLGFSDFLGERGLLYHSLIYEHPPSISRICEWMTEVVRRKKIEAVRESDGT